uniref:Uncharacterized protein n=1 Tax=Arundo donax TaxID=35708 RepID=A0A0A9CBC8_ARUDO
MKQRSIHIDTRLCMHIMELTKVSWKYLQFCIFCTLARYIYWLLSFCNFCYAACQKPSHNLW